MLQRRSRQLCLQLEPEVAHRDKDRREGRLGRSLFGISGAISRRRAGHARKLKLALRHVPHLHGSGHPRA